MIFQSFFQALHHQLLHGCIIFRCNIQHTTPGNTSGQRIPLSFMCALFIFCLGENRQNIFKRDGSTKLTEQGLMTLFIYGRSAMEGMVYFFPNVCPIVILNIFTFSWTHVLNMTKASGNLSMVYYYRQNNLNHSTRMFFLIGKKIIETAFRLPTYSL